MRGIEPVMDEIRDILREHLNDKIDAYIVEYADGVDLPHIDSEAVHLETPEGQEFHYPLVVIGELGFSEAGASSSILEATYAIGVDVWDTATVDGMENLHRRLWRYSRAVLEVLREHATDATSWVDLNMTNRRARPLITADERAYFRAKGIAVGVLTDEDY